MRRIVNTVCAVSATMALWAIAQAIEHLAEAVKWTH